MATPACRPETVFESATVDIQHCPDCQMIHLTMGSITIRMTEQHFSQYAQDVSKGLFELNAAPYQSGVRVMM
ncbi:hypothetical protein LP43_2380 [Methylophaga thiooxydans]|uniref:Uncharacterized protein n=1 Tax=Methylophaga thiooxydans TaxID=392484 RepID=A0A0A0BB50_9GAMM|nr:hypothetical protein [Methylophaga thiooxydans]KGM05818.1 hypothetical protein LP43_2380 [Methylophaga thiooxydans]